HVNRITVAIYGFRKCHSGHCSLFWNREGLGGLSSCTLAGGPDRLDGPPQRRRRLRRVARMAPGGRVAQREVTPPATGRHAGCRAWPEPSGGPAAGTMLSRPPAGRRLIWSNPGG